MSVSSEEEYQVQIAKEFDTNDASLYNPKLTFKINIRHWHTVGIDCFNK